MMLKNPKIAPRLAFEVCGLFSDVEQCVEESKAYYEEQLRLAQEQVQKQQEGVNNNEN